jgi:hypothetical protein
VIGVTLGALSTGTATGSLGLEPMPSTRGGTPWVTGGADGFAGSAATRPWAAGATTHAATAAARTMRARGLEVIMGADSTTAMPWP